MNFIKPANTEIKKSSGLKRRSFFGRMGIGLLGLFIFSKMPGKLFKSVTGSSSPGKASIKISENPQSVKRQVKKVNIG